MRSAAPPSSSSALTTWLLDNYYELSHAALSLIAMAVRPDGPDVVLFAKTYKMPREHHVFLQHFQLVVWMTYRKDFAPIAGGFTSDTGWGCMLRTTQMLLCQALLRKGAGTRQATVGLFHDDPDSAFSLGNFASRGNRYGIKPGQWYNPTTAMLVVRDLVQPSDVLGAVVARDGVLDASQVLELLPGANADMDPLLRRARSVLILVPVRLGLRQLNPAYVRPLLAALALPQSVGAVGGKPAHSLYCVGSQGEHLVYLDPHAVRPASMRDAGAYRCPSPRIMLATDLDPSLALGFVVDSLAEFQQLRHSVKEVVAKLGSPLFDIVDGPVPALSDEDEYESCRSDTRSDTSPRDADEDFVLI
jgi:cysteine protease ATG4